MPAKRGFERVRWPRKPSKISSKSLYSLRKVKRLKTSKRKIANVAGRVVIGPKKVNGGYARIVAQKDGSGCIESFDLVSRTWSLAPQSVTFSEVWSAPPVSITLWASIGDKS
jgi:hypothetical protein